MDSFGTMQQSVELLGTRLKLHAGQRVRLHPATNQPQRADGVPQYFASPVSGVWGEDSILIENADVEIETNGTEHRVPDRKPNVAYLADMEFGPSSIL